MPFIVVVILAVTLIFAAPGPAHAQDQTPIPQLYEFNAFGGTSIWQQRRDDPFFTTLIDGGLGGIRAREHPWQHLSLEQSFVYYGTNNLRFHTVPTTDFGARIMQIGINPLFEVASRDSRTRPFFTVGYQTNIFYPTSKAAAAGKTLPNPIAAASASFMRNDRVPAFNYGAGFTWKVAPEGHWALGMDVRGILSGHPHYGFPNRPTGVPGSLFITDNPNVLNGFQSTAGVSFIWGSPPVEKVPPPPPPEEPPHTLDISEIRGVNAVCPGDPALGLTVSSSQGPTSYPVTYQWTVDGVSQGSNSNTFQYTPGTPGDHRITVTVRDTSGYSKPAADASRNTTVHVRTYAQPTVTANADKTTLDAGANEVVNLTARGTASECGGMLSYSWGASEGTVTGGAQGRFDSSTVSFDRVNRDRLQTKSVTLTATVRDEKNGTASAPVTLQVQLGPEARRFDDIVFASGSSRVNNCGKRILLDEVYPVLANNTNYDLVLVGHIDAREARTARGRQLDRARTLSAAGVMVTGSGTTTRLEQSRIKTDWVGTDQSSEARPGFCGTSTRARTQERSGQAVSETDQAARNRRVEVWLVPRGLPMPPAVKAPKDLPANFRPPRPE